jgi:hypothetical protein
MIWRACSEATRLGSPNPQEKRPKRRNNSGRYMRIDGRCKRWRWRLVGV